MAEQSTTSESASTLDSEINELLGDFSAPEVDESPESVAGTTPVAETVKTEVGAEGDTKEVRAETTSADAAKETLDKEVVAETPSEDDPLKDAKPYTYSFDGQEKAIEGIQVLAGGGAIVPAEALAILTERLTDGERFHSQTREQYATIQNYEKLSAFHTKDAEGKDVTLNGAEGLLAARTQLVTLGAEYEVAIAALKDPQILVSLLAQNEKGEVILNQREFQNLVTRSNLAYAQADQKARGYFGDVIRPQPAKAEPAQVDHAREAPAMIDRIAGADSKLLSEADKKFLSEQFPRYLRTVTEDDRRQNTALKVGSPIVDASFVAVVKDRVATRSELVKTARATQSAADENTKRLAAAAIGTRVATKPAAVATVTKDRATDADEAWRRQETALARAL